MASTDLPSNQNRKSASKQCVTRMDSLSKLSGDELPSSQDDYDACDFINSLATDELGRFDLKEMLSNLYTRRYLRKTLEEEDDEKENRNLETFSNTTQHESGGVELSDELSFFSAGSEFEKHVLENEEILDYWQNFMIDSVRQNVLVYPRDENLQGNLTFVENLVKKSVKDESTKSLIKSKLNTLKEALDFNDKILDTYPRQINKLRKVLKQVSEQYK